MKKFGILGAGHLAGFVCEGLCRGDWDGEIVVSPHNQARAESFRNTFNARIATSNQAMLDECELVMLAVRPDQCGSALRGLAFPDGLTLLSVMAGVPVATIAKLAPGAQVVRAMPVSSASINRSPTTLYPDHALSRELLERIGTVTALETEAVFESATVNAAVYGWVMALIKTLIESNLDAGLSEHEARQIVINTVTAAADVCAGDGLDVQEMLDHLITPGGITAQGLSVLEDRGALEAWREAWQAVNKRLSG